MSFQPIIPTGGLTGWGFLQRTRAQQMTAFEQGAVQQREMTYFRESIAGVTTAEQLVSDRRLLQFSLTAFGLEGDINNTFFIRKILEEGVTDRSALANKLTDTRYRDMAGFFGFDGTGGPNTIAPGFSDRMTERYTASLFEVAVGDQQESFRLSLYAERELADLAADELSDDARWFKVMGSPPLREIFETALGLPDSFGKLDIDRQLDVFRDKTRDMTGSGEISQFASPDEIEKLVERYLLMTQLEGGQSMSSAQIAITLLQN